MGEGVRGQGGGDHGGSGAAQGVGEGAHGGNGAAQGVSEAAHVGSGGAQGVGTGFLGPVTCDFVLSDGVLPESAQHHPASPRALAGIDPPRADFGPHVRVSPSWHWAMPMAATLVPV